MVAELAIYVRGWGGYFGFSQIPSVLEDLDKWMARRLRCVVWKQWKRGRVRYRELRKRGASHDMAATTAGSVRGPWRISRSPTLHVALPKAYLSSLGLPAFAQRPGRA